MAFGEAEECLTSDNGRKGEYKARTVLSRMCRAYPVLCIVLQTTEFGLEIKRLRGLMSGSNKLRGKLPVEVEYILKHCMKTFNEEKPTNLRRSISNGVSRL